MSIQSVGCKNYGMYNADTEKKILRSAEVPIKEYAEKINNCKRKGGTYYSDKGCLEKDEKAKFEKCESNGRGKIYSRVL